MEQYRKFFEDFSNETALAFTTIPQSGSARKNFIGENSTGKYVITYNEDLRENESFLYFSEIFAELKLNTPRILKISADRKLYIQDYLGAKTLSEIIADEGESERISSLVKKVLDNLYLLQRKTENRIDFSKTFEYESYDELPVQHDLYYFKFFFADQLAIPYHKATLLKEFRAISEKVVKLQPRGLMIRDFQARNIMVDEEENVHFIDYQGAMEGPYLYDVISFLYQAKANFAEDFREEMLRYYISKFEIEDQQHLKESIPILRLIRNLQVLGAYGFRGLIQKKQHFIDSIPQAVHNLQTLCECWPEMQEYPELKQLISSFNKANV